MAISHTRVAVSPLGRAKWWLRDGKVEAMDSPITYANADAQGVQDLSVEGGGRFFICIFGEISIETGTWYLFHVETTHDAYYACQIYGVFSLPISLL
jgi:hypothetical protein